MCRRALGCEWGGGGGFQRTTFKELNAFGGLYSTLALMDDELAAALLGRRERAQLDDIPHTSLSLSLGRTDRPLVRPAGREASTWQMGT